MGWFIERLIPLFQLVLYASDKGDNEAEKLDHFTVCILHEWGIIMELRSPSQMYPLMNDMSLFTWSLASIRNTDHPSLILLSIFILDGYPPWRHAGATAFLHYLRILSSTILATSLCLFSLSHFGDQLNYMLGPLFPIIILFLAVDCLLSPIYNLGLARF